MHNLKPEANEEESVNGENYDDEDEKSIIKIMSRRVSMNEQNNIGINFEKYNREAKTSADVRRKIANLVLEYNESKDRNHAKNSFLELCEETQVQRFVFLGFILHYSFSFD